MSIGNNTQAVKFDDAQLTLVFGNNMDMGGDGSRNGVGKTTIINALSFGLYGEAITNIKRDNLINKTNGKGMIVTVEFECNGNEYRIERGRKPGILKFECNGDDLRKKEDEQQGDSRETQREIDRILGFSHSMFKHLIALNTYSKPFLAETGPNQREMIELLLGITELSEKAKVLSEKLKKTRDLIKQEEVRHETIKQTNERIEANISELHGKSNLWQKNHDAKIESVGEEIVTLQRVDIEDDIAKIKANAEIDDQNSQKATLQRELDRVERSIERSQDHLAELKSNIEAAENGKCPACGQGTAHLETHEDYKAKLVTKLNDEMAHLEELAGEYELIDSGIAGIGQVAEKQQTYYKDLTLAESHRITLDARVTELERLVAEDNPYTEQINSLKETALQEIDYTLMNELDDLKIHQEFLYKLLTSKDSFIRKKIIDQSISFLNRRLSHYLERIGLPHQVKFSSDLSVEITEYGRELDFHNLSRGEMTRVILSLSFAFRDIYESLNKPMNLLCIDEFLDGGLDSQGIDFTLAILKELNRTQKKSIILVSNREDLQERVGSILKVTKEGGYTSWDTDVEVADG